MIILPLLAVAATATAQTTPTINPPAFVMSIDETGRAVCSGPTEQQRIMIRDHVERHRFGRVPDGDVDYLVDSSETVTLRFRGVPRAAREAIWRAMDLWYEKLEITVPFTLTFYWEEFEEDEDGHAPLAFAISFYDEDESEGSWICWSGTCWPMTLGNQFLGYRRIGSTDPDPEFEIHINEDFPWYQGISGRPTRYEYDLVTIILHEIGHALGFNSGFYIDQDERIGKSSFTSDDFTMYYDHFVWSQGEGDIIDLPRPSEEIYDALTRNRLFWGRSNMENRHNEPLLSLERNREPVMLWAVAATTKNPGNRVSHLDEHEFYDGHRDSLMSPAIAPGQANHSLGPVTLGMLYDLGWNLKGFDRNPAPPPPPAPPTPPPPPPGPVINPDAAELWLVSRLIGSEEGNRGTPHFGILTYSVGVPFGLFGVESDEPQLDRSFGLMLSDPIHSRSTTVHLKTDTQWVPHLNLAVKNQALPEDFQDAPGLSYFNVVELTDTALDAFLKNEKTIELHIHFEGDSRRTVLTFLLRVPIN